MEMRLPDIGDFSDVPVIEVHVAPGDQIAAEDPVVTLESDKATMDVPATEGGVVTEVRVSVGDTVSEGDVILTFEPAGAGPGRQPRPGTSRRPRPRPWLPAPTRPATARRPRSTPRPSRADPDQRPHPGWRPRPAPAVGRPAAEAEVLVLEAGPGGYSAAFRAADLGGKVAIVDAQERLGGVCLNIGCIPSKALLHMAGAIAETREMGEHGAALRRPRGRPGRPPRLEGGGGQAPHRRPRRPGPPAQGHHRPGRRPLRLPQPARGGRRRRLHPLVGFQQAIIACGSRPVTLPFIPDDPRVIDSEGALELTDVPERLLILGGGIIGLEMARLLRARLQDHRGRAAGQLIRAPTRTWWPRCRRPSPSATRASTSRPR